MAEKQLIERAEQALYKVYNRVADIHEWKALAEKMNGIPRCIEHKTSRTVAKVMGRDGTQMDTIFQVE